MSVAEPNRPSGAATAVQPTASRLHVLRGQTAVSGEALCFVVSEARLAWLAAALGAERCGGPLSASEQALFAAARHEEPLDGATVAEVRRAIRAGDDPLGEILCVLRPPVQRRSAGAFYMPPAIVSAMTRWLLAQGPDRVIDPGCGSGRFAAAVSRLRPEILLIAVDTDPLATLLTRATLAVLGARRATVYQHDYLTLPLAPYNGRTGFIANPPYVRHHDLSVEAKAWGISAGTRLGISVSGLSGLHTLFYLATALQSKEGDVGCFVTSAEWLDTRYGQAIRRLLTGHLGLRLLALLDPKAKPFADAMTTAAITCFQIGNDDDRIALQAVDALESLNLAPHGASVQRRQLAAAARWSPFLRPDESLGDASSAVPLRSLARVHRGIATGCNEFFVLSREQAERAGLLPWCNPAITRAEEILQADGVVRNTPGRRLLLMVPRDVDRRAFPALDAYLRLGEQERDGKPPVAHGYLARHRAPWWYLGQPAAPPIVASYMARQAPAFAHNPDRLVLLNIAHGLYPHRQLSDTAIRSLVRQLNVARGGFHGHDRTYHGGLEKFEPREMEELPIRLEDIEGLDGARVHLSTTWNPARIGARPLSRAPSAIFRYACTIGAYS